MCSTLQFSSGPEGWMASNETGSSCFTECLGSILYQMCRKSPYSKAVKLINTCYSNENVTHTFTYQVVSILKGTLVPYSLRRFLWPLALFTVAEMRRTELDNPIIWDGHRMRELESSARKHFGILLASGTQRLGLTTPLCSKFDEIINKDMKEITRELQAKFKDQQTQFNQFKEQSVKILNVFYTAKQIYDPLYIYWLLPIHFALKKEHMHELIKHFPDIPSRDSTKSTDEGIQIYSFALCLSIFVDIMIKKYGLYFTNISNMINKTINNLSGLHCVQHIEKVCNEFLLKDPSADFSNRRNFDLFVGTVNTIPLLFFWDQYFLNSFNSEIIIEFAETLLVLLGSDILKVDNFVDMQQLLKHGPNKLLTKDIIQTWNMIHLNKVIDDSYYKLNRLSGQLISVTKEIQDETRKVSQPYLQGFVIHNIIITTVTNSRNVLSADSFRIHLDYIVENEIKQSLLTKTTPVIIFHGKISRIYDRLDEIYSTDKVYSRNRSNAAINYSYLSFNEEQSKTYITMFQFIMEEHFSFMIYPYTLWTREVINPVEQGTFPEIPYDPSWTLEYLLIPFNYLYYHFYSLPILETDVYTPPELLHGSRISLRIYNTNLEVVPKVIDQPDIYITRSVQTKILYKETIELVDSVHPKDELVEEQEIEDIEELSPPATPIDDPWVPFKKLAPSERLLKPSSTSEPFCIYIDQLRFMPDNSTIFKVTGRLLNTKHDEELLDILIVPEENSTTRETSRSPKFPSNQRFIINLSQNKDLSQNCLLFLRVYTLRLTNLEYVVVGNVLLRVFNSKGLLNLGGHQLRLRCEVPKAISQYNNNEVFYQEDSLSDAPYIHCSTILVRLLPYTEEPIPAPEYRFRSYRSSESTPTNFEWVVYRQFQSDEGRKTNIRNVVKTILRREGEFNVSTEQSDFLTPEYLCRYTQQRLSVKRNTTTNGIPNQMTSAFPFFYRINDGFLLSLKGANGLTVKEGDYIFALAKVVRGSDTMLLPVNKFYGFGADDDLIFYRLDSTVSLENPIWEDEPQLTKPYYDSNALLIIQIFRVPLIFAIGGSINITKSGDWFTPQVISQKTNKRQVTKLRRTHLIGLSFLRLFDWGFLRNGTHKLYLLKPPVRLHTLNKIQNRDGEKSLMLSTNNFLENGSVTVHLQSGRFLDFTEEIKTEQQPFYSHIPNDQQHTINESENVDEQMKQTNKINLDSMIEFRAKTDISWLQQNEVGSNKFYAEIHELLKNEVFKCSIDNIPLFLMQQ
ncbi:hypothetical protein MN116_002971 [Schistosoma mekongi]|uniref:Uncharacterized protein n=1 Tax=Schistosoma mekongi TaxID=38744 RepID=A0AAE2D734_SCHME|nr:hypothetical protein MN116_002971 [Schistosoma mekongi]